LTLTPPPVEKRGGVAVAR